MRAANKQCSATATLSQPMLTKTAWVLCFSTSDPLHVTFFLSFPFLSFPFLSFPFSFLCLLFPFTFLLISFPYPPSLLSSFSLSSKLFPLVSTCVSEVVQHRKTLFAIVRLTTLPKDSRSPCVGADVGAAPDSGAAVVHWLGSDFQMADGQCDGRLPIRSRFGRIYD